MKKNRLPHPPLEPAGDGIFTPAESSKTRAARTAWQSLANVGALGFTLVGCTFLGLFAGYNLDRWLKTNPWFTILLLLAGITAGFINIFYSVTRPVRRPGKNLPQSDADRNR